MKSYFRTPPKARTARITTQLRSGVAIGTATLALLGYAAQAQAEVVIDLWNDVRIGFESGNFDATTFSGKISDASLYVGDLLVLTASTLDVESDGTPNDGNWKVRRLDMRDANFVADNLSAGHVLIENFDLGALRGIANVSAFDDGLSDNSSALISDIRYEGHSAVITVDALRSLPFSFNSLPNGTRYARHGGFGVEGLTLQPRSISADAQPYVAAMKQAGFANVSMDLKIAQKTELVLGELHSQQAVQLGLRDLADLSVVADVKLQLDTFDKLVAFGVGEPDAVGSVLDLLGEIELVKLAIDYTDSGLIDLGLKLQTVDEAETVDAMREATRAELQNAITGMFPRNGVMIYAPLDKLLTEGGGVRLRVAPGSAVPLSNMLGFMIVPDLALDQLNVKVVHIATP